MSPTSLSISGLIFVTLLTASSAFIVACASGEPHADSPSPLTARAAGSETRLQIVASLYPLAYFTERVGGDGVDVTLLIEPGVETHDFEPTTGDLKKMRSADLVIYSGEAFGSAGFEAWVNRATDSLGDDAPAAVGASTLDRERLLPPAADGHDTSQLDPHVWLDPTLAADQVRKIETALAAVDPESAAAYRRRAKTLIGELNSLDLEFRSVLGSCRTDVFVTSHNAYSYLAERYGLDQLAIAGTSPEAEPGPGTLAEISDRMQGLGLRHVLTEPIISPRLAQTIAEETAAEVLTLHPLENLTPAEAERGDTYFSLMRSNLETLSTVLGCTRSPG